MWHTCLFFIFLAAGVLGQNADDVEYTCVPYYLCKNGTESTDGEGLLDLRFEASCDGSLEVLCHVDDVIDSMPVTEKPSSNAYEGCGVKNSKGVGVKIVGYSPDESQFGEFPWMVAIFIKQERRDQVYTCGGVLIHPQAVITVAHCFRNLSPRDKVIARAGEWDVRNTREPIPHQERFVENVTIHEDYNSKNLRYDIAFLYINDPFELTKSIRPICLPTGNREDLDLTTCYVTGWGKREFHSTSRNMVILKKLELPTVLRNTCQNALRRTRLGRRFFLDRTFVCAGGEAGKDACTGDGGSPLVCPIDNKNEQYVLAGLVAWGIGCGTAGLPGVYVNIPILTSWIDEQILINFLDMRSFEP